jgi:CheY-like chemotaxis protein
MTTELTQPRSELGPVPANGQEQGHRRRRRRRKNKSSQAAGAVASQQAVQAQPPPAEPAAQHPRQPAKHKPAPQHQSGHKGGHQGGHQNQGRKKKFFQKGSAAAAQPGNSISAPPQGKRKAKQTGPREFVGPMDHSYRLVNGNIADGPPSTIPTAMNGRNGGSYYQDAYEPQPSNTVREDAPARIYCFIEDMFFLAKIQETARKLGVKVEFVKGGDKDSVAALAELPETERPKLLVFDLNNLNAKPLTLIPKFKAKLKKATSIIGFLNHLQGELKAKAIEAGCDTVMPRSAFSQSLPNLLRRYGMEEEEEYAAQPV